MAAWDRSPQVGAQDKFLHRCDAISFLVGRSYVAHDDRRRNRVARECSTRYRNGVFGGGTTHGAGPQIDAARWVQAQQADIPDGEGLPRRQDRGLLVRHDQPCAAKRAIGDVANTIRADQQRTVFIDTDAKNDCPRVVVMDSRDERDQASEAAAARKMRISDHVIKPPCVQEIGFDGDAGRRGNLPGRSASNTVRSRVCCCVVRPAPASVHRICRTCMPGSAGRAPAVRTISCVAATNPQPGRISLTTAATVMSASMVAATAALRSRMKPANHLPMDLYTRRPGTWISRPTTTSSS